MTQAISSAHWLVVAMMARLRPPEISGITMASARSPSCRQLEHDRLERADGREPVGQQDREQGHQGDEQDQQAGQAAGGRRRGASGRSPRGRRRASGRPRPQARAAAFGVRQPAAAGPAREPGDRGRDQDDEADHDLEEVGRDAEQVEAVLQHARSRMPSSTPRHGADAAVQAGPAEHRRRQHVELVADHRVRHALADAVRLDQARPARP